MIYSEQEQNLGLFQLEKELYSDYETLGSTMVFQEVDFTTLTLKNQLSLFNIYHPDVTLDTLTFTNIGSESEAAPKHLFYLQIEQEATFSISDANFESNSVDFGSIIALEQSETGFLFTEFSSDPHEFYNLEIQDCTFFENTINQGVLNLDGNKFTRVLIQDSEFEQNQGQ